MLDYHNKYEKDKYNKVRNYAHRSRTQTYPKNYNYKHDCDKFKYKHDSNSSHKLYRSTRNYGESTDSTKGKVLKNQIIPNKNIKLSRDRSRSTDKETTNREDDPPKKSDSSFKILTFETSVNWYDMNNDGNVKGKNSTFENLISKTVPSKPGVGNSDASKWMTEVYKSDDNLKSKTAKKLNPYIENYLKSNDDLNPLTENKIENQQKFNKYQNTGKPISRFNEPSNEILPSKITFTKSAVPVLLQGANLNEIDHINLCKSSTNNASLNSNNADNPTGFGDKVKSTVPESVVPTQTNRDKMTLSDLYFNSNKYSNDLSQFNSIDNNSDSLILPSINSLKPTDLPCDSNNYGASFTNFDVFNYDHQKSNLNTAGKVSGNQFYPNKMTDNSKQFESTNYDDEYNINDLLTLLRNGQNFPENIALKESDLSRDFTNYGTNFTNFDVIDYHHQKVHADNLQTLERESENVSHNQLNPISCSVNDDSLAAQLKALADMVSGPVNAEDHCENVVDTSINLTGNKWALITLDVSVRGLLSLNNTDLERFHKKDPRLEFYLRTFSI